MPACHAGGRGFESPHGRHMGQYSVTGSGADCKSVALGSVGSSPTWPTKCLVSSDGRAVPSYGKGRRFDACTRHHYGVLDKRLSPWPFKPESPVRIRYTSPCGRSSNGRAPGCGPGGCGFEFRRSPQIPPPPSLPILRHHLFDGIYSTANRLPREVQRFKSSTPLQYVPVAQWQSTRLIIVKSMVQVHPGIPWESLIPLPCPLDILLLFCI